MYDADVFRQMFQKEPPEPLDNDDVADMQAEAIWEKAQEERRSQMVIDNLKATIENLEKRQGNAYLDYIIAYVGDSGILPTLTQLAYETLALQYAQRLDDAALMLSAIDADIELEKFLNKGGAK